VLWVAYDRGRRHVDGPRRARLFAAGLVVVVAALVSPLDALAGSLASAHMVQHLLLSSVAAPLLVFAVPAGPLTRALPSPAMRAVRRCRRRLDPAGRLRLVARHPGTAWAFAAATLWSWHAPVLYDLALRSPVFHAAEHLGFLVSGLAVWSVVRRSLAGRQPTYAFAMMFLFTLSLQATVLAALMTFSTEPWYGAYETTTTAFGLSARSDQQLAALLMWFPLGALHLVAALVLLERWLHVDAATTGERVRA
jgi:cytochrome c oxidase assembly factor CtaG